MLDVLIKNANIIDGTGKPAYKGSIGISGGKLVMADGSEEATAVIDASGKYVSPGWIDAHSHGDLILGSEDAHLFKTTQGVTTELTGQCGLQTGERRADDKALRPERYKGREVFCAARKEGHCGPADLQQSGTVRSISGGRIHAVEHISRLDDDSVDVEVLQLVQVTLGGVF